MHADRGREHARNPGEQLETLLSQPVSRRAWLGGRLLLAVAGAMAISAVCGLLTWTGATTVGVNISLARMLEACANCLPVAVLFLGLAALAYVDHAPREPWDCLLGW